MMIYQIRQLTDEERIEAVERARQIVTLAAGTAPTRDKFQHYGASHYPAWFNRLVAVLMAIVLIAAAMPSLFRLYTAGHDYFLHGIDNPLLASIVGISTFLLAEFLIILSTISARVYFTGRARLIFVVPIVLGLAMALVGNYVIAKPADLFGWLETLVPPVAVLFLALIGERLILDAIEARHANERAYQLALASWHAATAQPEHSPRWKAAYSNALKAALISANSRERGATERKAIMAEFTTADWRRLIDRELSAEDWYTSPEPVVIVNPTQAPEQTPLAVLAHMNGNHG
jgi:hypothetical protein